eukprot:2110221-Heterocapsa_arctica.AAC.1
MSIKATEGSENINIFVPSQTQVDHPPENIPRNPSNLGLTIPGATFITAQASSCFVNPDGRIPRAMDKSAASSA